MDNTHQSVYAPVPEPVQVCSQCHAAAGVPIEYGYPSEKMIQQTAVGVIRPGGSA